MLRAARYRLYPTAEQRRILAINFGCARYVYNDALALIRETYRTTGKSPKWAELSARLPKMKKELPWLGEANAQVLQQSLANLAAAFEAFFHKHAKYPKFKSRKDRQSIRFPQAIRIENNCLFLQKIGSVNCIVHRKMGGELRSATVSLGQD
ncbi:MAG: helix-turn-helix domain-containing protein, partial [Patescibacteria group bacterium]|nr:helix-turn-helix domain-containing protein [Patescibacteria group bacterium]